MQGGGLRNYVFSSVLVFGVSMLRPLGGTPSKALINAIVAAPASHTVILEIVTSVSCKPRSRRERLSQFIPSHGRVLCGSKQPQPLTYITCTEQDGKWIEEKRLDVPMGKATQGAMDGA